MSPDAPGIGSEVPVPTGREAPRPRLRRAQDGVPYTRPGVPDSSDPHRGQFSRPEIPLLRNMSTPARALSRAACPRSIAQRRPSRRQACRTTT